MVVLFAACFARELRQQGIDMNALLESIHTNHRRIYEDALLEAGMPFRYPDESLTPLY